MDETLRRGFNLGEWQVEPMGSRLVGPSGDVHTEPRIMDVLVVLASAPGEVIERNEFIDKVWDGRAVADEPLTRCIKELRRILDDSPRNPKYIETVHKRGYRLIAPVSPIEAGTPASDATPVQDNNENESSPLPDEEPRRRFSNRERMLIGLVLVLGVFFLAVAARNAIEPGTTGPQPGTDPPVPDTVTVVVLPFKNLSGNSDNDYFSDGLSQEIRNRLADVEGLSVIGHTTSDAFRDTNADAKTIAARVGATHLIDGSVQRDKDRIRIAAELADRQGIKVWDDTYDGIFGDVFSLQDDIANDIVSKVAPELLVESSDMPIRTDPPTQNLDAYELVLRARFQLQRRDEGPLRQSIALFEQAIELDENYGDAYVGLATAHAILPFYSYDPVESAFALAMATIEQGARKDPTVDAKSAGLMAFMRYRGEGRWIEAETGFRRALEYAPSDAELLQWYSQYLGSVGRTQDALQQALRAKELDQLSPVVNHRLAVAYLWINDDDKAREQFRLAEELGMGPASSPAPYIIYLIRQQRYDEAKSVMAAFQSILGFETYWIDPVIRAFKNPDLRPDAVEAIRRADEEGQITLQYLFGMWVYLDETERALDIAFDLVKDLPNFNPEFLFAAETSRLRQHPRFGDLIRAMGLDQYWDYFGWPDVCRHEEAQISCR